MNVLPFCSIGHCCVVWIWLSGKTPTMHNELRYIICLLIINYIISSTGKRVWTVCCSFSFTFICLFCLSIIVRKWKNSDISIFAERRCDSFFDTSHALGSELLYCQRLTARCFWFLTLHAKAMERYCHRMASVCPSVCPSVTLMDADHIRWPRWNFITRLISPVSSLAVRKISAI